MTSENAPENLRIAYLAENSGFDCIVFAFSSVSPAEIPGELTFKGVLALQAQFNEDTGTITFMGFSPFSYWSKDLEITLPKSLICGTMSLSPTLVPTYKEAMVQIKAILDKPAESDNPVKRILKLERPKS